jgi:hypothetical protein
MQEHQQQKEAQQKEEEAQQEEKQRRVNRLKLKLLASVASLDRGLAATVRASAQADGCFCRKLMSYILGCGKIKDRPLCMPILCINCSRCLSLASHSHPEVCCSTCRRLRRQRSNPCPGSWSLQVALWCSHGHHMERGHHSTCSR